MKTYLVVCATSVALTALLVPAVHARSASRSARTDAEGNSGSTLVYADFENAVDGRPVSARGGKVNLWGYQEAPTRPSVFKGNDADNATPKLVRTSKADQNHAAAFDY